MCHTLALPLASNFGLDVMLSAHPCEGAKCKEVGQCIGMKLVEKGQENFLTVPPSDQMRTCPRVCKYVTSILKPTVSGFTFDPWSFRNA